MRNNPNSSPRGDECRVHGDSTRADHEPAAGQRKTRRRGSRSGAAARDCPPAGSPRAPFRVTIHPFHGPAEGVDVTDPLVGAIALVLWKLHGGNEPVNRVEATVLLERAMERQATGTEGQCRTHCFRVVSRVLSARMRWGRRSSGAPS